SGVLPASAFARPAAMVTLPLLVAIEDFMEGWPSGLLGFEQGNSGKPPPRQFARARVYAQSLDDVAPLSDAMQSHGYETVTHAAEIQAVKSIDRVLGIVFGVIAWTAVLGCTASLTGAFLANIDRKRKDLALLRLLGYGRDAMVAYVLVQAVTLTTVGF